MKSAPFSRRGKRIPRHHRILQCNFLCQRDREKDEESSRNLMLTQLSTIIFVREVSCPYAAASTYSQRPQHSAFFDSELSPITNHTLGPDRLTNQTTKLWTSTIFNANQRIHRLGLSTAAKQTAKHWTSISCL